MILPDSDMYDSVLCTTVADLDFDGENEILLGTYGQVSITPKASHCIIFDSVFGEKGTTVRGK